MRVSRFETFICLLIDSNDFDIAHLDSISQYDTADAT